MGASIADGDLDDDGDFSESHEINVTPFIDVILVLLIIFMVAAPLSTVDVAVDLPASSSRSLAHPDRPVSVTVRPDLTLVIGETIVTRDELSAALNAATLGDHDTRLYLRADKTISYGDLMGVMDALRMAGYLKVALVAMEHTE
jgi:biopolymer transport protein ExbD